MQNINLLGMCRRAGKLSPGHDASKDAIRRKRARLILIASDASDRLKDEIKSLAGNIPLIELEGDTDEISLVIGRRAAVMTVDDDNFAKGIISNLNKEG